MAALRPLQAAGFVLWLADSYNIPVEGPLITYQDEARQKVAKYPELYATWLALRRMGIDK